MTETDFLAAEIMRRFGTVRRARGCFLYTESGTRLTDLYREGGRAILGWHTGAAFTHFKNTMNRGITGSFITDARLRLVKSLCTLLNSERQVYAVYGKDNAISTALKFSQGGVDFWHAWNPVESAWSEKDAVIVAPPLAWAEDIFFVCVKPLTAEKNSTLNSYDSLKGRNIPAPLCAAITRSIYDLIAKIQVMSEKDWFIYDKILIQYWERKGPYLFPKIPENEYKRFVLHCLDSEIVISPDYNTPSIVPFYADLGVFRKLENNPFLF